MKQFKELANEVQQVNKQLFIAATAAVNTSLTVRNWIIGWYIVEYEQNGDDRATYGEKLLESLAEAIQIKGLSAPELSRCRQFYSRYRFFVQNVAKEYGKLLPKSILGSLTQELENTPQNILGSPSQELQNTDSEIYNKEYTKAILAKLSYSHLTELIKIDNELKRTYYEVECIKGTWSVRELKRQINTLAFERSSVANNPQVLIAQLGQSADRLLPQDVIKSPYVFDFLKLSDNALASESEVENQLLNDLRAFMLELGHGFCLEAQQKRLVIGGEYFFVDLVFYHRILKCHILFELKLDGFNHQHIGQLNTYLHYFKNEIQQPTDNPPIGILLCTSKNEALVEYALGGMDKNLFVSQYQTVLPDTKALEAFLTQEKEKLSKDTI